MHVDAELQANIFAISLQFCLFYKSTLGYTHSKSVKNDSFFFAR